ncbi:MAG: hypothetical protein QXU99_04240 [Candidatus Bathyarchaeia archaeon]
MTITGKTTIPGLSGGLHNITVYAKDEFGNTGNSEMIIFRVAEQQPFPAIIAASCFSRVTHSYRCIPWIAYFKKRRR